MHDKCPQLIERVYPTAVWSQDGVTDTPTTAEYTFFPKARGIFTMTDHDLSHKMNLNNSKRLKYWRV